MIRTMSDHRNNDSDGFSMVSTVGGSDSETLTERASEQPSEQPSGQPSEQPSEQPSGRPCQPPFAQGFGAQPDEERSSGLASHEPAAASSAKKPEFDDESASMHLIRSLEEERNRLVERLLASGERMAGCCTCLCLLAFNGIAANKIADKRRSCSC